MNEDRFVREGDLLDALKTLELWSLDPVVRESTTLMDDILADDFIEYGQSGSMYSKVDLMSRIPYPSRSFEIDRFEVRSLGVDHALAIYRLIQADTSGRSTVSNRCSIWQKETDRWRMIFHQGTRLELIDEKGSNGDDHAN